MMYNAQNFFNLRTIHPQPISVLKTANGYPRVLWRRNSDDIQWFHSFCWICAALVCYKGPIAETESYRETAQMEMQPRVSHIPRSIRAIVLTNCLVACASAARQTTSGKPIKLR